MSSYVAIEPSTVSDASSRFLVGVPRDEALLTAAAIEQAHVLLRPGPGRSLIILNEVELGSGRPDLLLLAASKRGLLARASTGLRLANLTEARVLAGLYTGTPSGHSQGHVRAVTKRLQDLGWLADQTAVQVSPLIATSLLVEAKVRDWRTGIGQLSKNRWAASSSALLVPAHVGRLVPRQVLRHNRLGLIALSGSGQVSWQIQLRRRPLPVLADLWLSELAIRSLMNP